MNNTIKNPASTTSAVAYISLTVPTTKKFLTSAVHNNQLIYMQQILRGLKNGFRNFTAFSAIPIESYPRSNRLWIGRECVMFENDTCINCLAFLNITGIKQILIGLSVFFHILVWGWRNRHVSDRVVFAYNLSVPHIMFYTLGGWFVDARVIAFIGDVIVPGQTVPYGILYRIDGFFQKLFINRLDGYIVVADKIALDFAPGKDYLRIDGGVGTEVCEKTGEYLEARIFDESIFKIVVTGTLSEFNGINEVIRAFSLLSGCNFKLCIAGRGDLEQDVLAAVKKDPRIEYLGYLDYDDMLRLHSTADVLVSMRITKNLITDYAFPSKTFEYLLSGIPVITTCTGHMKEEYRNYCLLLMDETVDELAKKIQYVASMKQDERFEIGRTARDYILNNKLWSMQMDKVVNYICKSSNQ